MHICLKLFDRTVDLAPFDDDSPLYSVSRAWVHGYRIGQGRENGLNKPLDSDSESLPKPKSVKEILKQYNVEDLDEDVDIRCPAASRKFKPAKDLIETFDKSINSIARDECLAQNKQRWAQVRKDWRDARRMHEARYEESLKALQDMFTTEPK